MTTFQVHGIIAKYTEACGNLQPFDKNLQGLLENAAWKTMKYFLSDLYQDKFLLIYYKMSE